MNKSILFCTHAYPPDAGGIAAFAKDLNYLFKSMGFSVTLLKSNNKIRGNRFFASINFFLQFVRFFSKIIKNDYSIVFCTRVLPFGLIAMILKLFFQYRLIIQVHGTEVTGRYKKGWRKKINQFIYNCSDQVWSNSENTYRRLVDYGVEESNIKVVYPFLTDDISEIEAVKVNNRVIQIFTAASLYPRKGIDIVLKALSKIQEFQWEYVIAGNSGKGYEGFYEALAEKLKIRDKVQFLGQLERHNVWRQMKQSDLFVLPSRKIESFGIVFIEAQYFGTPCIGTNIWGIPEAIGEGGIMIPDEDVNAVSRAFRVYFEDEQRLKKDSRKALYRVRSKFLMKHRIKDVSDYLMELNITSPLN